ncbi:hypothetical protein BDR05DRAFT_946994 [Suillus weaverae]|nr:hypothetical protein BDR05DRAFT_946994 [Suillus weaverae]
MYWWRREVTRFEDLTLLYATLAREQKRRESKMTRQRDETARRDSETRQRDSEPARQRDSGTAGKQRKIIVRDTQRGSDVTMKDRWHSGEVKADKEEKARAGRSPTLAIWAVVRKSGEMGRTLRTLIKSSGKSCVVL